VPWEKFEAVLPYTDVFLYDIKSADNEKHKCCTGVGNELIIENLHKLSDANARIYLRLPVIAPSTTAYGGFDGVNYSDADIEGIIKLLPSLNIEKIYILPYHNTGTYKHSALGLPLDTRFAVPDKERLHKIKQMLESVGVDSNVERKYEVILNG
jgi:pyruvate formate lyase activating enzyme